MHGLGSLHGVFFCGFGIWGSGLGLASLSPFVLAALGCIIERTVFSVWFGFMGLSNFGYQRMLLLWPLGLRRLLIFIRIPLLYLYRGQIQIELYLLQSD